MAQPGTNSSTNLVSSAHIGILGELPAGNKLITGEFPVVELVYHKILKAIGDWIQVVQPPTPRKHIPGWNDETNKDDQIQHEKPSRDQSLEQGARSRADCSENHGHDHYDGEGVEQKEEEGSGFSTKVSHKVNDKVKNDGINYSVWHRTNQGRHTLGRRMVECISAVLLDNWPLRKQGPDLLLLD